ncbi:MAG: peroxidase family protein [Solirubrobacteraceae bacterium]
MACLALIDHGQFVLAGLVLGAGLLIEHTVQIGTLRWEIRARDIRMPRDSRWRPPSRMREPIGYLTSHFPMLWRLVQRIVPLARWFNRFAIRNMALVVDPRPNPLSTMAPYTSWSSLTDRTYSGRHLPPASAQPSAEARNAPPSTDDVAVLFERRGDMAECPKSTVLFSFFAQWFTDGFLRTARDVPRGELRDTLRNESNHEIDLVQIYGLNREMTEQLRARRGGLLKSQWIDGEEYPEYYCRDGVPRQEFDKLLTPVGFRKMQRADRDMLFAIGSDITNLGVVAFNVLFLREHNRIAARLSAEHPAWDDDRVFETTRNVLTVVLLKIVIDEYINHIAPYHFRFWLAPESFPNEQWYRPNWMAIEFNLLYRWHSMVPSTFHLNGEDLPIEEMLYDTTRLTAAGLGSVMAAASDQPAGRISLGNTDPLLVDWAEKPSIDQARAADLCSYNDYRRLCRYPAAADFDDISADPEIQARLKATYGSVEDVEFYVGLFAEDTMPNGVLPPLIAAMVSFDAFSQALTNPLLAPRIYNEHTFSPTGMQIIAETGSISDIVRRNVPQGSAPDFVSLTRRDPAQT